MLKFWQIVLLLVLGVAMWGLVTLGVARHPEASLDYSGALWRHATAPLGGAISILLCKFVGRLSAPQMLPGIVIVGAVAMMLDAVAIRWFPALYGSSVKALMLVGADLMWGYGVALAMAVAWTSWAESRGAPLAGRV
ncbi:hypothetical protein [Sphingobium nicotianae]|uniref:Uncharacterized protein n=1 Tax=Sphingobium nicotianae TaxID=2782607 RepID=A0A9X1IPZ8_9SPHN|nr:hypothetical protein [Sphingobium nicotianae]MBT2186344.1 hypothetical protein [Sphingobium nicotianae]